MRPSLQAAERLCMISSDTAHNSLSRAARFLAAESNKEMLLLFHGEKSISSVVHKEASNGEDFFFSLRIFFPPLSSLVRENGMHWWKIDALFSQPNSSRVVNADGVCAVSPGEK